MAERHVARGARSSGGALAALIEPGTIAGNPAGLLPVDGVFDCHLSNAARWAFMMTLARWRPWASDLEELIDEENDPGLATAA